MAIIILFAGMLALMLMRVVVPVGAKGGGRPVKILSLSFVERALMQRINIYALGFVLLLMAVTGLISPILELLVIIIAFGILVVPVRCVFTTEGVGINNVVFRPWKEFSGFTAERRRIRLTGREGTRDLFLPLLPGRQQEALPLSGTGEAYKGHVLS
jgi:hypothetical protein